MAGLHLNAGSTMDFIYSSNRRSTSVQGSARIIPLEEFYVIQGVLAHDVGEG